MKKLLSVFLMLLMGCFLTVNAQTDMATLHMGPQYDKLKKDVHTDIVAYTQKSFYVLKRTGKSTNPIYSLEEYSHSQKLIGTLPLNLKFEGKRNDYLSTLMLDGKLYVFSTFLNNKQKIKYLFRQTVDIDDFKLNNDIKKVDEISFEGKGKRNSGGFKLEVSADRTKFLVYSFLPVDKYKKQKVKSKVYDSQMKFLWKKTITMPYEDNLFSIADFEVNNDGILSVLGKVYHEKARTKRFGKVNYHYELITYNNDAKKVKTYKIDLGDGKFITDAEIEINKDLDIICAGFYSKKGTFSIDGSYFIKIDNESGKVVSESFKEFDIDFITQAMSEKEEAKAKRKDAKGRDLEMYEYDLDDIIIKEDGGAVLIGEQFFIRVETVVTTNTKGQRTTRRIYHYYYNDIIVINIDKDGQISWASKIDKYQHTTQDGGYASSYALGVSGDNLYFIYNDNPNMAKRMMNKSGASQARKKVQESGVVIVRVDSNGEIEEDYLFSIKDFEMTTIPKLCEQISSKELIIYGIRKKDYRFARAILD